jgi:hypothetical protein
MSTECETMTIVDYDGKSRRVINTSDYDPETMTLWTDRSDSTFHGQVPGLTPGVTKKRRRGRPKKETKARKRKANGLQQRRRS